MTGILRPNGVRAIRFRSGAEPEELLSRVLYHPPKVTSDLPLHNSPSIHPSISLSPAPDASFHELHWTLGITHIHDLRSIPEITRAPYTLPEKLNTQGKMTRYHTPVNREEDYSPEALAERFGLYVGGRAKRDEGHGRAKRVHGIISYHEIMG